MAQAPTDLQLGSKCSGGLSTARVSEADRCWQLFPNGPTLIYPQFNIGFDGKGYLTKVEADPGNSISATWMMKLAKGNKIRLQSRNYLWIDHWNPLTFTGELIHISDDAKKKFIL